MGKQKNQSGLAMVLVIWVLSLMTIMAGSFALTMRRETAVVSSVRDNAVLISLAEQGIAIAQKRMFSTDESRHWNADGSLYPINVEDAEIRVRLFSEKGKIDINKANEVLLSKLMAATSLPLEKQQALVSAILDWRDKDDLVRINGAEKQEYEAAELSYRPTNKAFQVLAELKMVLGMNNEVYQQIEPLITIYSGSPNVDSKLASKEVKQVIGLSDPDAALDNQPLNADSSVDPEQFAGLSQAQKSTVFQLMNSKGVYTIISQSRFFDEAASGIKVTFRIKPGDKKQPFEQLDWQQIHPKTSLFSDEMTQQLITPQYESELNN